MGDGWWVMGVQRFGHGRSLPGWLRSMPIPRRIFLVKFFPVAGELWD
jgi:hypothetical protein